MAHNFERLKKELPPVIGNMGQNFFRKSFEKGGFTDKSFKKWPERKNEDKKGKQRAILVKTSRLRNSTNRSLKTATFNDITFAVPEKYAQIHNEGGVIKMKERNAVLHFKNKGLYKNDIGEHERRVFSKAKGAHFAQKVNIGAHTIVMPKRQFMGHSDTLVGQIKEKVSTSLRTLHK